MSRSKDSQASPLRDPRHAQFISIPGWLSTIPAPGIHLHSRDAISNFDRRFSAHFGSGDGGGGVKWRSTRADKTSNAPPDPDAPSRVITSLDLDTSSPQAAFGSAPTPGVTNSPRATNPVSPELHIPDRASSSCEVNLITNTTGRIEGSTVETGVPDVNLLPGERIGSGVPRNLELNPNPNRQAQVTTRRHFRLWNDLLPWIQAHTNEIIGVENTGAIVFMPSSKDPRPVIKIISKNPEKANSSILETKLSEDIFSGLFVVEVFAGTVSRSMDTHAFRDPYQERPSCGASVGVVLVPGRSQTFGGYICLESQGKFYGLTCHHMLQGLSVAQKNDGVRGGILGGSEVLLSQPALGHAYFVHEQRMNSPSFSDSAIELHEIWVELFGRVICSSGYRLEKYGGFPKISRQIDWALITDIPENRYGSNIIHVPLGRDRVPATVMTLEDFSKYVGLGDIDRENEDQPVFPSKQHLAAEEQRKFVYGIGAISGLEGIGATSELKDSPKAELSKTLVVVKMEHDEPPSIESVFTPVNTLGESGDSGTWIFDADSDIVVGMITGCFTIGAQLHTIYTPMHAVFNDIMKVMGAKNVRLATELDKTMQCISRDGVD